MKPQAVGGQRNPRRVNIAIHLMLLYADHLNPGKVIRSTINVSVHIYARR